MSETLKKINYLTEEQYKNAKENDEINENEIYLTPDYETLEYSRILWVNPAPNATSFPAQEITLSGDDYDFFDILYYCYFDVHIVKCARVYKEHTPANLETTFEYNSRLYGGHRTITRTSDKTYSISAVKCHNFGGTSADTTTDWIIPIIIYGGKLQRKVDEKIISTPDAYSFEEVVIGEYLGKPLYRKVLNLSITGQNVRYNHGISNLEVIVKSYGNVLRTNSKFQNLIPGTYTNWEIWLYDFDPSAFTLRFSNNQYNSGVDRCHVVLEYTKTTD